MQRAKGDMDVWMQKYENLLKYLADPANSLEPSHAAVNLVQQLAGAYQNPRGTDFDTWYPECRARLRELAKNLLETQPDAHLLTPAMLLHIETWQEILLNDE